MLSLNQKFLNNSNNITTLQTDYAQLSVDVAEAVAFHKNIVHDDENIKALADRATANAGNIATLETTTITQSGQITNIVADVSANAQSIIDYNTQFQAKIDAEEARAIAAELVLTNDLSAEASTARAAESANAAAIAAEQSRAEAAELVLTNDLSAEATAARAAESANAAAVAAEQSRAEAAELVLTNNLSAEATAARAAELANANAVAAEETRATAAEGVLQANINTVSGALSSESATARAAESANAAAVAAEQSRAEAAELVLTNNLSAEATAARAAESANAAAISQAVSDAGVAIEAVNTSLNVGLSKMVFSQTFEYDGDMSANSYVFSMGNGCPTESDFGCPIPVNYKLHAIGVCRKSDDVASDLSIQFKVEHNNSGVISQLADVTMTGSNKQIYHVVVGSQVQSAGQVNVKFGNAFNVPSYGKYRVTLYMQSQDQFY